MGFGPTDVAYRIAWYDRDWTIKHIISEYISCKFSIGINDAGAAIIKINEYSPLIDDVAEKDIIQIHRVPDVTESPSVSWTGFLLKQNLTRNDQGDGVYEFECAGALASLQWAIVAWAAGTSGKSEFSSTTTGNIIKDLIDDNLGTDATAANGRERDFDLTGFIRGELSPPGSSVDYRCAWRNVYDVVMELAEADSLELSARKADTSPEDSWEIDYNSTGIGGDKTDEILLRHADGRLSGYNANVLDQSAKTVAIAGGFGQGTDRTIQVETGPTYNATHNSQEMFVDARDVNTAGQLTTRADARLFEQVKIKRYTVDYRQTRDDYFLHQALGSPPGAGSFSADFELGDTIKIDVGSKDTPTFVDVRIMRIDFSSEPGRPEKVTLTLEEQ